MRDAFFDELYEIAASDPDVLLLTDDQGAFGLERIKRELEGQYFNVGIAEQNLVSVAAGLALGGKRPFIYGISTFMTMRCFEQINVDLCCHKLPVTIVGSGAGYMYSGDGPTHHATQDIGILRTLPGMNIFSPSDAVMTAKLARIAHESAGPNYIRIEKPRRVAQLSDCYGAGTGCGWCRPFLKQLFATRSDAPDATDSLPDAAEYARQRGDYVREGHGTPPPGATPIGE